MNSHRDTRAVALVLVSLALLALLGIGLAKTSYAQTLFVHTTYSF